MKKHCLALCLSLITLASCEQYSVDQGQAVPVPGDFATKVFRPGDKYDTNSAIIKFKSVPDQASIDALLSMGVKSVAPVFPSTPGKEALEAEFGLDRWYEVVLDGSVALDAFVADAASLETTATVQYNCYATNDGAVYPAEPATKAAGMAFNDPYLADQWHYNNEGSGLYSKTAVKGADVNVDDVWKTLGMGGDPEIIVAVVDEGVKYTHPDLKANMWTNPGEIPGNGIDDDGNGYIDDVYGYNFVDSGQITWALSGDTGHGTHCAGTIAAVNNNNLGVCGVAGGTGKGDGCRIMSCQIFSGRDGGYSAVIAKAIKYAADMGASVISCSFGLSQSMASDNAYYRYNSIEIDAVHYFESCKNNPVLNGNIAVFASGNEGQNFAHYPGAFYDIISVSAIGPDLLPTNYTNYGPGCNIAAPGGELGQCTTYKSMVLSTVPSELDEQGVDTKNGTGFDYGYMQGTSMACPHVSGVVALALSYAKKLGKTFDRDEFKRMILSSTNDIDTKISNTASKSYSNVFITGTNSYYKAHADLSLAPYYHMMGTGLIDAWRLMMHIEGTPCSTAHTGEKQWISLDPYFGTASVSLTYLSVDVPQATVDALGLQPLKPTVNPKYPSVPEGECYAYVQFGRLYVSPTKTGSGYIEVSAIGGGDHLGGGDNAPGGMQLDQKVSLVTREVDGGNGNGGWL